VDVARDENDRLSFRDQRLRLGIRQPARIGEPLGDLAEAILVPQVRLGRDDRHDHLLAEGRLPQNLHLDARRRRIERAKVRLDLLVVRKHAILADVELEELGRGGELGGEGKGERYEEGEAFHGARIMNAKCKMQNLEWRNESAIAPCWFCILHSAFCIRAALCLRHRTGAAASTI
jgi:hypothetical protein